MTCSLVEEVYPTFSKERTASIFRFDDANVFDLEERISNFFRNVSELYLSARRHISTYSILHSSSRENFKSQTGISLFKLVNISKFNY
jgi:hypothetical protein